MKEYPAEKNNIGAEVSLHHWWNPRGFRGGWKDCPKKLFHREQGWSNQGIKIHPFYALARKHNEQRTRPKGFEFGSDELRKYQYLFGTLRHTKRGLSAVPVSYCFKYPWSSDRTSQERARQKGKNHGQERKEEIGFPQTLTPKNRPGLSLRGAWVISSVPNCFAHSWWELRATVMLEDGKRPKIQS